MQPDGHNRPDLLEPIRVQSLWDFSAEPSLISLNPLPTDIASMAPSTRSSARRRAPSASGSDYHESSNSMDLDDQPKPKDPPEEFVTRRGRKVAKKDYQEPPSTDDDRATEDGPADELDVIDQPVDQSPSNQQNGAAVDDEDEDQIAGPYRLRGRPRVNQIVDSDDEAPPKYRTRNQAKRLPPAEELNGSSGGRLTRRSANRRSRRTKSRTVKVNAREQHDDEGYIDHSSSGSADAEGSLDDGVRTSSDLDDPQPEDPQDGRPYSLRARAKINYAIPPPLDEMPAPQAPKPGGARMNGRNGLGGRRPKPPGWSATGAELSRWMGGVPGDDSVWLS